LASCHESSDAKPSTHRLADKSGGCDFFKVFKPALIRPASTSSGREMKASKKPSAGEKTVQTVQVVESFEGSENGTNPDVLAQEIVEDLEAALEQFREIAADLTSTGDEP
jgi:hypothetical protein